MATDKAKLKHTVVSRFKVSGFFLKSDSADYLTELLEPLSQDERVKWLKQILSYIQQQGIKSLNIERHHLEAAIRDCTNEGLLEGETVFDVINAFEVPRFKYDPERKRFNIDKSRERSVLAPVTMKSEYLQDRYNILLHRTSHHPLFTENPALGSAGAATFKLKKVEQLLSTTKVKDIVVLGLLTQLKDGKFFLEDPTGVVPLDLSEAKMHSGLFCEGSFVLAEGTYKDKELKVAGLGFPPPELASSSRAFFGVANTWGGKSKTLLKYSQNLEQIEKKNENDGIVFLADCCLDMPQVMTKLKVLFDGFDEVPPIAIVLMGPFMKNYDDMYALKGRLNALGDLINDTSRLKRETYIVLVPATEDPISTGILPRWPLAEIFSSELKQKCPKVICATNPCRIQYCTQQIVVFQKEIVTKLCRNTIKFPTTGTLDDHVSMKSVLVVDSFLIV